MICVARYPLEAELLNITAGFVDARNKSTARCRSMTVSLVVKVLWVNISGYIMSRLPTI
jgi:hypothetical protein